MDRHGRPASTGLPARAPAHRERTPARRGGYRRIARGLAAGALTLLASALCLPAANADEDGDRGWIDVIVDLLKPSGSAPVGVPLRKPDAAPLPPSATPDAKPTDVEPVPPPPSISRKAEMPERLEGAEPLGPNDVYRHAWAVIDELRLVGETFGASLGADPPAAQGAKTSADVAQLLLRATYKAINLQTRLGMDASRVPAPGLDRASPSQNYDLVNLLLAELARIKAHLGIETAPAPRAEEPPGKTTADALAVVQLIVANLDRLSAAVAL